MQVQVQKTRYSAQKKKRKKKKEQYTRCNN